MYTVLAVRGGILGIQRKDDQRSSFVALKTYWEDWGACYLHWSFVNRENNQ